MARFHVYNICTCGGSPYFFVYFGFNIEFTLNRSSLLHYLMKSEDCFLILRLFISGLNFILLIFDFLFNMSISKV